MSDHTKARRQLALRLAEDVLNHFPDVERSSYDVDEMAKQFAYEIPDTRAEADAEWEALRRELDDEREERPQRPSEFSNLREAVHALEGDSIMCVVRGAVERIKTLEAEKAEWRKSTQLLEATFDCIESLTEHVETGRRILKTGANE